MRKAILLGVAVSLVTSCSGGADGNERPVLVATTTVLGDVLSEIAGGEADVVVLMPVGVDPHEYQPSARDTATMVGADFVLANGLGLEESLHDVLDAAATDGTPVFELAPLLDPIVFQERADPDAAGALDPHVWMDPIRMAEGARLVGEELEKVLPGGGWVDRSDRYAAQLETLNAEVEAELSVVPPARRKLVTNHDALGYFADRYEFSVVGVIIPGGSTLAEPSSADLAQLVEVIDEEMVDVIFAETIEPETLAEAIAAESDRPIEVVELFTDSLGAPGTGADTLLGLFEVNASLIAIALGS